MAQVFFNAQPAALASIAGSGDTTITVEPGQGSIYPSVSGGDFFLVTLIGNTSDYEVVKCTGVAGDVLTVVRGFEGPPAEWPAGTKVSARVTQGMLEDIMASVVGGDGVAIGEGVIFPNRSDAVIVNGGRTFYLCDGRTVAYDSVAHDQLLAVLPGLQSGSDVTFPNLPGIHLRGK